ncbi:hypothetical protein BKA93DRAFT_132541 [Sparassis latifolia]
MDLISRTTNGKYRVKGRYWIFQQSRVHYPLRVGIRCQCPFSPAWTANPKRQLGKLLAGYATGEKQTTLPLISLPGASSVQLISRLRVFHFMRVPSQTFHAQRSAVNTAILLSVSTSFYSTVSLHARGSDGVYGYNCRTLQLPREHLGLRPGAEIGPR